MFVLNVIGSIIAAVGIYRNAVRGWSLGAFIAALSIISYVVSRTVSLSATEVEEWDLIGIISLAVEAGFLFVSIPAFFNRSAKV